MVDFTGRAETLRWLEAQPREVSVTIAARAALRVLPSLNTVPTRRAADFLSLIVLPCFRATAAAWANAKDPTRVIEPRTADAADSAASASAVALALAPGVYAAAEAAASAAAAAYAADAEAADAAVSAADAAVYHSARLASAAASSVAADAAVIEIGSNPQQRRLLATELAGRSLWPGEAPRWAVVAWRRLKIRLLAANEDWDVWTEWYDDRLAGRTSADPAITLAYVLPPDELWRDGPKAVNAEIKRLIELARKMAEQPDEAALPQQSPRAAIFADAEGGVIGLAPPTPQDRLADTLEVREFYGEVREKADYLAGLGVNMLGLRLYQAIGRFQGCTPASFEDAIERRVWSSGNALRVIRAEHDAVARDPDPHPHKLEPSVAETLRGFDQLFNQLAFADPSLRQRDARRPGPQEIDRTIVGLRIAIEIIPGGAEDRAITNAEAGAELGEQLEIARGQMAAAADSGLPSKLGGEHAAETFGNFISHAVHRVFRATRNHLGGAAADATSGFYRQAGATIFTSALAQAQHISPAIVHWVIASADQLAAFGANVYEHVPAFRETVEWLRQHVKPDE